MRYPKDLTRKADEILSQRHQQAWAQHETHREHIYRQHPDIWELRQLQNEQGVQLGKAHIAGNQDDAARYMSAIRDTAVRIGVVLAAVGLPTDYLEVPYSCPECRDTGYRCGRICSCRCQVLNELVYQWLSDTSAVDECSFDSFDLTIYPDSSRRTMRPILKACIQYADTFHPGSKNLLFTGRTGLGKTHLSLSIAREVVSKGYLVLYASAVQLVDRLTDSALGDRREDEYHDLAYGCDLLVLDDLGAEIKTHITRSTVYGLLDTRLRERLPTIINTNLSLKEIDKEYDQRITSRIAGGYAITHFTGDDIRFILQKRRHRRDQE